jgi:hypothetical protein
MGGCELGREIRKDPGLLGELFRRAGGLPARIGGEESAVILPGIEATELLARWMPSSTGPSTAAGTRSGSNRSAERAGRLPFAPRLSILP